MLCRIYANQLQTNQIKPRKNKTKQNKKRQSSKAIRDEELESKTRDQRPETRDQRPEARDTNTTLSCLTCNQTTTDMQKQFTTKLKMR